jgi:hypothetical protein
MPYTEGLNFSTKRSAGQNGWSQEITRRAGKASAGRDTEPVASSIRFEASGSMAPVTAMELTLAVHARLHFPALAFN